MTTAHVAAAVLDGTVPSEAELLAGLEWVIARHPMLRSRVAGRGKFFVQDAEAYPLHTDYLGRAVGTGDIDGDGLDDIIAGSGFTNQGSYYDVGSVYLFFGG